MKQNPIKAKDTEILVSGKGKTLDRVLGDKGGGEKNILIGQDHTKWFNGTAISTSYLTGEQLDDIFNKFMNDELLVYKLIASSNDSVWGSIGPYNNFVKDVYLHVQAMCVESTIIMILVDMQHYIFEYSTAAGRFAHVNLFTVAMNFSDDTSYNEALQLPISNKYKIKDISDFINKLNS